MYRKGLAAQLDTIINPHRRYRTETNYIETTDKDKKEYLQKIENNRIKVYKHIDDYVSTLSLSSSVFRSDTAKHFSPRQSPQQIFNPVDDPNLDQEEPSERGPSASTVQPTMLSTDNDDDLDISAIVIQSQNKIVIDRDRLTVASDLFEQQQLRAKNEAEARPLAKEDAEMKEQRRKWN